MKALCIVYENVDDWDAYDRYRRQVMPTLRPFGAKRNLSSRLRHF